MIHIVLVHCAISNILPTTPPNGITRGLSFTPEDDDAALARSWVNVSEGHDEQNAALFWDAVRNSFHAQSSVSSCSSTAESLRSRWATLQRVVQKYLAAEKAYRSKPVSAETSQDCKRNVMHLYCSRNKRKDSYGIFRDGPPLRPLDAVAILRDWPKFGGVHDKSKKWDTVRSGKMIPVLDLQEISEADNIEKCGQGALPAKSVASNRLKGVKVSKAIAKNTSIHSELLSLARAIDEKTAVKRRFGSSVYANSQMMN